MKTYVLLTALSIAMAFDLCGCATTPKPAHLASGEPIPTRVNSIVPVYAGEAYLGDMIIDKSGHAMMVTQKDCIQGIGCEAMLDKLGNKETKPVSVALPGDGDGILLSRNKDSGKLDSVELPYIDIQGHQPGDDREGCKNRHGSPYPEEETQPYQHCTVSTPHNVPVIYN
jgi:hypothetical protein